MFEQITNHTDISQMVWEALQLGKPAACHKSFFEIANMLETEIQDAFESGKSQIDYDWRFLNGTASGHMCFHSDCTLYGCYHFNGLAE